MAEPSERPVDVDPVHVTAVPDPHRIRSAIADALAGRPLGAGPEAEVARAVAAAVQRSAGFAGSATSTVEGER